MAQLRQLPRYLRAIIPSKRRFCELASQVPKRVQHVVMFKLGQLPSVTAVMQNEQNTGFGKHHRCLKDRVQHAIMAQLGQLTSVPARIQTAKTQVVVSLTWPNIDSCTRLVVARHRMHTQPSSTGTDAKSSASNKHSRDCR
jgi:hypothetical protein